VDQATIYNSSDRGGIKTVVMVEHSEKA